MLHKHKNNIEYKKNWEEVFTKGEPEMYGKKEEKKTKLYVGLRRMGLATRYVYKTN